MCRSMTLLLFVGLATILACLWHDCVEIDKAEREKSG